MRFTPLRAVSPDLQTIDAGTIERVEVIKGATAISGNEATKGLANYITSAPRAGGFRSATKVGSNTSLADAWDIVFHRPLWGCITFSPTNRTATI